MPALCELNVRLCSSTPPVVLRRRWSQGAIYDLEQVLRSPCRSQIQAQQSLCHKLKSNLKYYHGINGRAVISNLRGKP